MPNACAIASALVHGTYISFGYLAGLKLDVTKRSEPTALYLGILSADSAFSEPMMQTKHGRNVRLYG